MQRHGRQTKLAEVGFEGQARIAGAHVEVRADGLVGEVAVRYLAGAGVGRLRVANERLAQIAKGIDASIDVEANARVEAEPRRGFRLDDETAREVARGAEIALNALQSILREGAS